jgi:hypothetical protein
MLRAQNKWMCRLVLAAVAVWLGTLPLDGRKAHAGVRNSSEKSAATPAEPEPFELSYLPPDARCVLALRPAALLRRPGLAGYAAKLNLALQAMPGPLGLQGKLRLSAEDVEQVIMWGSFARNAKDKEHPHSVSFALPVIRCVRDFDWKAQMKEFLPQSEQVHHAGGVYYRQPKSDKANTLLEYFCWYIPDGRTLVTGGEDALRKLIEDKGKKGTAFAWAAGWKKVDRSLCALALHTQALDVNTILERRDPTDALIVPVLENASWLTLGIDGGDEAHLRAFAQCPGEDAAGKVLAAARTLLEQGRKAVKAEGDKAHREEDYLTCTFVRQLLQTAAVRRQQTQVEFHCHAGGFNEYLQAAASALEETNAEVQPSAAKP